MNPVRLNKYLAHTFGISRREADNKIEAGHVVVNGKVAALGTIIVPERDKVVLDHTPVIHHTKRYTYVLMNKPTGFVCSRKQQGTNQTIYSILPRELHHLKVAGRLDKDSCGLLLLTDDGDTIFKLTHPKFSKQKIYYVTLNKPLSQKHKEHIENGIILEDGISKLQIASITLRNPKTAHIKPNTYKITMHEGRNRQIRRTFKQLGYTVTYLERIKLGAYSLNDLGKKRYLQI